MIRQSPKHAHEALTEDRSRLRQLRETLRHADLDRRFGVVRGLHGLAIESVGPKSHIGELCAILPPGASTPDDLEKLVNRDLKPHLEGSNLPMGTSGSNPYLLAEVVGIQSDHMLLMPYGSTQGLVIGSLVVALPDQERIGVGEELLGRVIDAFGRPIDGKPLPATKSNRPIKGKPSNPMRRPRINTVLETGIRTIDALLTLGQGQRVGIFAGSGVGKSTLLGMISRHVKADVNVIALIGERGREVRDFIEKHLGQEGLRRSVVVVATADQPALARTRAAHAAMAIAEHFRDEGKQVLLTMDSITRLAMARREIGLSAGEPPTARGYTPSVFAELPELCERCGTAPSGGAITALFTVLVEGDDLNEPVSDSLRAILDGHIVLSRHLAHQGQYPAIDVLKSASRLLPDLINQGDSTVVQEAIRVLALLDRNRQMVELGAYEKGSNPELDAALASQGELHAWLKQSEGGVSRTAAMQQLIHWQKTFSLARVPQPGTGAAAIRNSPSSPSQSATQIPGGASRAGLPSGQQVRPNAPSGPNRVTS